MRIRRAQDLDLEPLVALVGALFAEDGGARDAAIDSGWPARCGRSYYASLLGDEEAVVLVAEEPAVVGFLVGRLRRKDPLRPAVVGAELESMFVTPAVRSRGFGRALVDDFHRWAERRGTTHIGVTAYATNAPALRFYRSLGYRDRTVALELTFHPSDGHP